MTSIEIQLLFSCPHEQLRDSVADYSFPRDHHRDFVLFSFPHDQHRDSLLFSFSYDQNRGSVVV